MDQDDQATAGQLRDAVIRDLRCPIDWSDFYPDSGISQIFLEKWARTVETFLPDGDLDTDVLRGDFDLYYLSEPDDQSFSLLDTEELRTLAHNTAEHRAEYREAYFAQCISLRALKPQPRKERHKHFVRIGATSHQVRDLSRLNPSTGLFLPFVTQEIETKLLWISLSDSLRPEEGSSTRR